MHNLQSTGRCCEKGIVFDRKINLLVKTPADILRLYDRIKGCHLDTGWEKPVTLEQLMNPEVLIWTVDDVGMIIAVFGPKTHVHIFFWDRRLRGREKMCRIHAANILRMFHLAEIWTVIPQNAKIIAAFARRVGFKTSSIVQDRLVMYTNPSLLYNAITRET